MVRTVLARCIVALVLLVVVAFVVGAVWASIESGYHWSGDRLAFWPHAVAVMTHAALGTLGVVSLVLAVRWAFHEVRR